MGVPASAGRRLRVGPTSPGRSARSPHSPLPRAARQKRRRCAGKRSLIRTRRNRPSHSRALVLPAPRRTVDPSGRTAQRHGARRWLRSISPGIRAPTARPPTRSGRPVWHPGGTPRRCEQDQDAPAPCIRSRAPVWDGRAGAGRNRRGTSQEMSFVADRRSRQQGGDGRGSDRGRSTECATASLHGRRQRATALDHIRTGRLTLSRMSSRLSQRQLRCKARLRG